MLCRMEETRMAQRFSSAPTPAPAPALQELHQKRLVMNSPFLKMGIKEKIPGSLSSTPTLPLASVSASDASEPTFSTTGGASSSNITTTSAGASTVSTGAPDYKSEFENDANSGTKPKLKFELEKPPVGTLKSAPEYIRDLSGAELGQGQSQSQSQSVQSQGVPHARYSRRHSVRHQAIQSVNGSGGSGSSSRTSEVPRNWSYGSGTHHKNHQDHHQQQHQQNRQHRQHRQRSPHLQHNSASCSSSRLSNSSTGTKGKSTALFLDLTQRVGDTTAHSVASLDSKARLSIAQLDYYNKPLPSPPEEMKMASSNDERAPRDEQSQSEDNHDENVTEPNFEPTDKPHVLQQDPLSILDQPGATVDPLKIPVKAASPSTEERPRTPESGILKDLDENIRSFITSPGAFESKLQFSFENSDKLFRGSSEKADNSVNKTETQLTDEDNMIEDETSRYGSLNDGPSYEKILQEGLLRGLKGISIQEEPSKEMTTKEMTTKEETTKEMTAKEEMTKERPTGEVPNREVPIAQKAESEPLQEPYSSSEVTVTEEIAKEPHFADTPDLAEQSSPQSNSSRSVSSYFDATEQLRVIPSSDEKLTQRASSNSSTSSSQGALLGSPIESPKQNLQTSFSGNGVATNKTRRSRLSFRNKSLQVKRLRNSRESASFAENPTSETTNSAAAARISERSSKHLEHLDVNLPNDFSESLQSSPEDLERHLEPSQVPLWLLKQITSSISSGGAFISPHIFVSHKLWDVELPAQHITNRCSFVSKLSDLGASYVNGYISTEPAAAITGFLKPLEEEFAEISKASMLPSEEATLPLDRDLDESRFGRFRRRPGALNLRPVSEDTPSLVAGTKKSFATLLDSLVDLIRTLETLERSESESGAQFRSFVGKTVCRFLVKDIMDVQQVLSARFKTYFQTS